jgi:hypothetical protein
MYTDVMIRIDVLENQDMQMTKLVRSLFFRLNSSEPLRCTRNKSLPASWITPRRMGRLVGILMASNDQDLETWVQVLRGCR